MSYYWMIRAGEFGYDSTLKLILTLIAIAICIYDWKQNNRKDYFWVFLVGAMIWAGVEIMQNMSGMRLMPTHVLFGIELPVWAGAILQGTSEGAYVAVLGLFVADNFFLKENRKVGIVGLVIMIVPSTLRLIREGIHLPINPSIITSARAMFTPVSFIFLGTMVLISIIWLVKTTPEARRRGIYMYVGMVILAVIFTVTEVIGGTRWIGYGPDYGSIVLADVVSNIGALSYDIFVEIAAAYVPFLLIPYAFGLIRSKEKVKSKSLS
ncbi:MAG: hypothetical protein ACTSQI_07210 [Candidatus Helarchaeota archaeon]